VGGDTGNTGGDGIDWSARGEACIDSSDAGGDLNVNSAAGDTVEDGGGVLCTGDLLGGDDLAGDDDGGDSAGGEMTRSGSGSSSYCLRSSSSHRRFRVLFAGGGAVGEGILGEGSGGTGRCGRGDWAVGVCSV
jgi:hypothetical protein